jgi:hypothetical protein
VCGGHSATSVGTLLQHIKGRSAGWLTIVSSPADLSCPSWARAEGHRLGVNQALLIQRNRCKQPNSSNLLIKCEFVSPDAGVCRLQCSTLPYFTHTNVRVCRPFPHSHSYDRRVVPYSLTDITSLSDCPACSQKTDESWEEVAV